MTSGEKVRVLQDLTVVVDTREKQNKHILDYLKENNIPYIVEKLDSADYSFILPNYPELNLDKSIVVERKGHLSELAGNFTQHRERFKREFERIEDANQQVVMVVETATWRKLFNGTYRSSFHPNAYKASMFTWMFRYNCPVLFCEPKESPEIIHKLLHYGLSEKLAKIE